MDYPIHIDTRSIELSILCFKGLSVKIPIKSVSEDCFYHTNSADPDKMPTYVSFHPGLHCLTKYLSMGTQNEKG